MPLSLNSFPCLRTKQPSRKAFSAGFCKGRPRPKITGGKLVLNEFFIGCAKAAVEIYFDNLLAAKLFDELNCYSHR